MPEREVEITIGSDGMVEVHARGFKGKGCTEVSRIFEKMIGELQAEQKTSEFYEPEEQVQFWIDQKR